MEIHGSHVRCLQSAKRLLPYWLIGLVFFCGNSVWAEGGTTKLTPPVEQEGVVKLVATLQDSPAFTDVVWKLYRRDRPGRPVMTIKRHSAIVSLRPGEYRAVALLASVVRSKLFKLKSRQTREIILSMDK